MAEIFRGKAVAAGGFEKPVAIKRILPHLSQDKRFVELLIAEAKVLSLLKHRNIVQIFDVGLGDDGQYFLVMEYVDGKDLGAVQKGNEVKRRRMPFDLALHIGAEICEALEHAHSAKAPDGKPMSLVHRDVSPSNVLLSRAGEVKLTDFGIAKRAEQEQTGTGGVRGKFAYISPEQARNEHIEPRSDVFSVAISDLGDGDRPPAVLGPGRSRGAARGARGAGPAAHRGGPPAGAGDRQAADDRARARSEPAADRGAVRRAAPRAALLAGGHRRRSGDRAREDHRRRRAGAAREPADDGAAAPAVERVRERRAKRAHGDPDPHGGRVLAQGQGRSHDGGGAPGDRSVRGRGDAPGPAVRGSAADAARRPP